MLLTAGEKGTPELADIIDVPSIQSLLEHFHKLTRIPLAIVDDKGKVLVGMGWQDICTRFHRVHPETCRNCMVSDTQLSEGVVAGEYRLYKCKNNMWDVATPLIVDGKRVGNLFTGQFFLTDEEPDRELFRAQAKRYGFHEEDYLAAMDRVPRRSREHVETTMRFFAGLAQSLAQAGWSNVSLARSMAERERVQESLRESEGRVRLKLSSILSPEGDLGTLELSDIVDAREIQSLMDNFHQVAPMPMFLVDIKGKVLGGVGWADICTRFHRIHPETYRNCVVSDTEYSSGVPEGQYKIYKCKNNMWSVATPIIVGGKHVGNLFSGQFFFTDEEPEREIFRAQAKRYGFPEQDYLAVLDRAPRLSRTFVAAAMEFYLKLAQNISQASWSNICLARSVAERERATEVLRASERRMARAQKFAHIGNWDLDAVNNHLTWSDGMCEIFGLKPQDFDGTFQAFLACVHPDDRGAFVARYSESLGQRRDDYEMEFRGVRASTGEIRTIHAKGEFIRDGSGQVVGSRGLAHDITELKIRENELRRVNRMLRARSRSDQAMLRATDEHEFLNEVCKIVVEDCGHAMVWVGWAEQDKDKTVRPAAYAGCAEEDLKTLKITWADTERGRGPTGTAIRTGKPSICRNILADPNTRPWRKHALKLGYASSAVLPLMADGKAFGAIAIYSGKPDAFTEEEMRLLTGLADDLAYGIGALRMREARKLAETHFQQAQKMEAVGLLAGGIAHDFNNLLAIIIGYNELLLEGLKRGDPLRAHSLEIQNTSTVGAALTQQLLGISGNRGVQNRFLDPNSVILQMMKMLRRLLSDNIRLETKRHRSVWPVKMGSGQLEQIILNLAVNARDAMPKGGRLTLTTKNQSVKAGHNPQADLPRIPGHYVVLEVSDTGCGMAPAVQARLFEPFFTTKGPGRGTGLGLSTIQSIVKEHQGHISVESQLGRGTVFRIYLPSIKGGAKAMIFSGLAKKSRRVHGTIMVVEDNESLLAIIKMTLQRAGYTVFSGRNAEQALSLCGEIKNAPDVLLTDVVLPDLDGPELAKRVKDLWPGIRTAYMSGYPGNALAPIADYGGCVLLEKPFSLEHLLNTLREVLAKKQGDLF